MAYKRHDKIADEAIEEMAVKLLNYYKNSLEKMGEGTAKPSELRYVVDAGVKVIGFLEPRTEKDPDSPPSPTDPDKLKSAFGKLLAHQKASAENQQLTPHNETLDAEPAQGELAK